MDTHDLGNHILHRFDEELGGLRDKVLATGGLVEDQLGKAIDALVKANGPAAARVIEDDRRVNELELEIDDDCTRILARRNPVASDLRLVMAVSKAVTDLERMGDEAVRVARMAAGIAERGDSPVGVGAVRPLGRHVQQMLHDALDAFARMDVALAGSILEEDREVDREYESLTRELITRMMEDPRLIPTVLEVQWAARALERIGDRACNIAEYVIYFVRGHDVRHSGHGGADPDKQGG